MYLIDPRKAIALLIMFGTGSALSAELEEVLVTAQRREQSLQTVPVSLTVFSGTAIEKNNIRSATDYLAWTPNVSFTEDGQVGSRGLGLSIRGVNNLVSGENAVVNSIGIYIDQFSVASIPTQVANPFLPDMERVEVLRGPQGTYFGRNSLGGALNLTTQSPVDEFGGKVLVGGEFYESAGEQYNFTGIANIPVTEDFALRAVAYYEDSTGLVKNTCAAGAGPDKCPVAAANGYQPSGARDSGYEYFMGRIKTRWTPTDSIRIDLTMIYAEESQGHDANVPSGIIDLDTLNEFSIEEAIDPGTGFWPDNRNLLSHDRREANDLDSLVAILNVQSELNENLHLSWVIGVLDAQQKRLFDNDLVGGADNVVRDSDYNGKSWGSELRLDASGESIDWTLGVLYANDDQQQVNDVFTGVGPVSGHDMDPPNGVFVLPGFPPGLGLGLNNKRFELDSLAVYADTTVRFGEHLELIVGGRYTHDKVDNSLEAFGARPTCCRPFSPEYPGPPGPEFFASFINVTNPPASGKETFRDFSPRLGLRYELSEDASIYALASKGYKAGGTSLGNSTEDGRPAYAVPFEEETLWNYELGLKSEWLQNRLRLNAALFYLEWDDMQFESFLVLRPGPGAPAVEQTINIEAAEVLGGELEFSWVPTDRFSLDVGLGYQDSEITRSQQVELTGGYLVQLRGLDTPQAPEFTASLAAEYRQPFRSGEWWLRLEYIHRDGQYSDIEALTNQQTLGPAPASDFSLSRPVGPGEFPYRTPDYDVVNLRAGLDAGAWNLVFYVQNATDEEYYTGTRENFGASGIRLRPHPRTFGFSLSYNFGN